jgi:P-type E1-E2 ATPase
MYIEIPGYLSLDLKYLLLDYNGTIAVDGVIPEQVKEKIREAAKLLDIYVLTADTHGTAAEMCAGLPLTIKTFPKDNAMDEKFAILTSLGTQNCVAVGNGRNDVPMCSAAALSIAVLGTEGAYGKLISQSDICVSSIEDGLDLLLNPKRLIATLRG